MRATRQQNSDVWLRITAIALSQNAAILVPQMTPGNDKHTEEVRRLFAELHAAYQRAADAASPPPGTDTGNRGKLLDEGAKALALIQRIRELDRL